MPPIARRPKSIKFRLSPESYNALLRLSELTDQSLSATVADILQELQPGILHTIKMLEESKKLNADAKNNLTRTLEKHEQRLRGVIDDVQEAATAEIVNLQKLPL
jgi:hypothetical protein